MFSSRHQIAETEESKGHHVAESENVCNVKDFWSLSEGKHKVHSKITCGSLKDRHRSDIIHFVLCEHAASKADLCGHCNDVDKSKTKSQSVSSRNRTCRAD
jgi:hypothetical protein